MDILFIVNLKNLPRTSNNNNKIIKVNYINGDWDEENIIMELKMKKRIILIKMVKILRRMELSLKEKYGID